MRHSSLRKTVYAVCAFAAGVLITACSDSDSSKKSSADNTSIEIPFRQFEYPGNAVTTTRNGSLARTLIDAGLSVMLPAARNSARTLLENFGSGAKLTLSFQDVNETDIPCPASNKCSGTTWAFSDADLADNLAALVLPKTPAAQWVKITITDSDDVPILGSDTYVEFTNDGSDKISIPVDIFPGGNMVISLPPVDKTFAFALPVSSALSKIVSDASKILGRFNCAVPAGAASAEFPKKDIPLTYDSAAKTMSTAAIPVQSMAVGNSCTLEVSVYTASSTGDALAANGSSSFIVDEELTQTIPGIEFGFNNQLVTVTTNTSADRTMKINLDYQALHQSLLAYLNRSAELTYSMQIVGATAQDEVKLTDIGGHLKGNLKYSLGEASINFIVYKDGKHWFTSTTDVTLVDGENSLSFTIAFNKQFLAGTSTVNGNFVFVVKNNIIGTPVLADANVYLLHLATNRSWTTQTDASGIAAQYGLNSSKPAGWYSIYVQKAGFEDTSFVVELSENATLNQTVLLTPVSTFVDKTMLGTVVGQATDFTLDVPSSAGSITMEIQMAGDFGDIGQDWAKAYEYADVKVNGQILGTVSTGYGDATMRIPTIGGKDKVGGWDAKTLNSAWWTAGQPITITFTPNDGVNWYFGGFIYAYYVKLKFN